LGFDSSGALGSSSLGSIMGILLAVFFDLLPVLDLT
jgi:hypothetical protein